MSDDADIGGPGFAPRPPPRIKEPLKTLPIVYAPATSKVGPLALQWDTVAGILDLDASSPVSGIGKVHLRADGYRIISLSAFGNPNEHRLAAVWEKREGPDWKFVWGTSYQELVALAKASPWPGYSPVELTTRGSTTGPFFFAAIYESFIPPIRGRGATRAKPPTRLVLFDDTQRKSVFTNMRYDPGTLPVLGGWHAEFITCATLIRTGAANFKFAAIAKRQDPDRIVYWNVSLDTRPNGSVAAPDGSFYGLRKAYEAAGIRPVQFHFVVDGPGTSDAICAVWHDSRVGVYAIGEVPTTAFDPGTLAKVYSQNGFLPYRVVPLVAAGKTSHTVLLATTAVPLKRKLSIVGLEKNQANGPVIPVGPLDGAVKKQITVAAFDDAVVKFIVLRAS